MPTMPYSAALGESNHWLDVLLKKDLSVVKYPAEQIKHQPWIATGKNMA